MQLSACHALGGGGTHSSQHAPRREAAARGGRCHGAVSWRRRLAAGRPEAEGRRARPESRKLVRGRHGGLGQSAAAGPAGRVPGADLSDQAGDLLAHKRFSELLPKEERESILLKRVPKSKILTLPELRANPFQDRICRVFSTAEDGDGSMSFEDFLDLLSVFSDSATVEIKSHYAFRIFDFDDDGILDRKDLEKLVNCLTGEGDETRLSESEMDQLIQNILEESDIDKDGTINLSEFQHVISRSPDFASSFKIVL
ncbi:unnamed protein product [Lepidochelys kempii]